MKPFFIVLALLLTTLAASVRAERQALPFDAGWRFLPANAPGAELDDFDDSTWRQLDLPHDWSIEGPFAPTNKTGGAGGFLPSGVAWYRKTFSLPEKFTNQIIRIELDGVMQNSDVWINGIHLGHRPNGYVSFSYQLTPHLKFGGAKNLLAVRCDTSDQPASRWYSGAGIYRHVRLVATSPAHFIENGIFISTPEVSSRQATVRLQIQATNSSAASEVATFRTTLLAPGGKPVAVLDTEEKIPGSVTQHITLPQPELWSSDSPALYRAVTELRLSAGVVDRVTNTFGIRSAEFTATNGFVLNGNKVVLKGVCVHHDGGAFGAAVPLAIWEQRLTELRKLGVNAIRTAHNPVAPEFLDLCDRMGFLVMDEFFDCWTVAKNPFDYAQFFREWSARDAADTVRRDRNHPSVILYSIGNEIHDTRKPAIALPIASNLVAVCHANDPTRPVTQALFRPNVSGDYTNGLADLLDVVGTNYRDNELLAAQRDKPARKIIGTEQRHERQTWLNLRDYPTHSGQFLWTGVDYLGESKRWPIVTHSSGLLDRTGDVKPMAYERQSWWSSTPMVRLVRRTAPNDRMPEDPGYGGEELHTQVQFADWTPRNPKPHDETVEAYSNADEVELFLNGQSLGTKKINADASPRVWKVAYAPGTLRAVARDAQGKIVATDELRTAGAAKKILLTTESKKISPGFHSVAIIRARVVDAHGVTVPRAEDSLTFQISGPGVIAAVDSGHPASIEPLQATSRRAFQGKCVAFVKATAPGKIEITATAPGLKSHRLTLRATP